MTDPAVRLEAVAAAAGLSLNSLRRARVAGKIPPPDAEIQESEYGPPARAWKLSTIRSWNPAVADRCARLIEESPLPPMAILSGDAGTESAR